jgi:hypothetical protein
LEFEKILREETKIRNGMLPPLPSLRIHTFERIKNIGTVCVI